MGKKRILIWMLTALIFVAGAGILVAGGKKESSGGSTKQVSSSTSSGGSVITSRSPGKTPPKSWPPPPTNIVGRKPKWDPQGFWKGRKCISWDSCGHGSGHRGQGGHWDEDGVSGPNKGRWTEDGTPITNSPRGA